MESTHTHGTGFLGRATAALLPAESLSKWLSAAGMSVFMLMVFLTFVDVFLRYWFGKSIDQASSLQEMEALRVEFLGRKGRIARIMSRLPELEPAQRPLLGQTANRVKESLTAQFEAKKTALDNAEEAAALARFDAGLPGRLPWRGSLHPVTMVMEEICTIFKGLGYDIVSGPEVETDYYCFEALNIPPEHPARDMQDTLYVSDGIVLRTHTSPLQVRTMLKQKPPVAVVAPGRVYRRDSDITHTPMFHQVEGLLVDKHVTMADRSIRRPTAY